jgi:chromosome segregation ATPase
VSHGQPTMAELLKEIDRLRRERDEALARVAELKEREETTRGELRDLRGAVDRLTAGLTEFLDASRPAGPADGWRPDPASARRRVAEIAETAPSA